MSLLEEIHQTIEKSLKREKGSIMLVTVGLVIVILILTAAAIHWTANLGFNQFRFNAAEIQKAEPYNANAIINAQIRRRLVDNNPTNGVLYDNTTNFLDELDQNLTRNARPGLNNMGFYLVNNTNSPVIPSWPAWMTTQKFITRTEPRADNPLFHLFHVSHPDPSTTNTLDIKYQLYYWGSESSFSTNAAEILPIAYDTNSEYIYTNSIHIREVPSSQLQLISVDEFDTTKMDANLVLSMTNGLAFFPYGIVKGNSTYGGSLSINSSCYAVTSKIKSKTGEETGGSFGVNSQKLIVHPNMGVSWMMEPYALAEADSNGNFQNQKYASKSLIIDFDGRALSTTSISAIKVEKSHGALRVVINVAGLSANNGVNGASSYYINCTTPLAKQRGIVLVGAGNSVYLGVRSILTNGALRLEGEQTSPLVTGTSYGGVVFTGSIATSTWNTYIINAGRPPVVLATSDRTTYPLSENPISQDIGTGSGIYRLGSAGMNYDSVQIKGRAGTGGIKIGFGYSDAIGVGEPNGCYFQLNAGSAQAYVYEKNQPKSVGSPIALPAGTVDFEITYHRAINALGISFKDTSATKWSQEYYISLNGYISRVETTQAAWNGGVGNISIIARASGSAFYGEDSVGQVNIQGGLMVGKNMGGNAQLTISPSSTVTDFFTYPQPSTLPLSDRFLLFDP